MTGPEPLHLEDVTRVQHSSADCAGVLTSRDTVGGRTVIRCDECGRGVGNVSSDEFQELLRRVGNTNV